MYMASDVPWRLNVHNDDLLAPFPYIILKRSCIHKDAKRVLSNQKVTHKNSTNMCSYATTPMDTTGTNAISSTKARAEMNGTKDVFDTVHHPF